MAAPSYTYSLTNGSTADATQVMQNYNDILNGVTDGTKDITVNAVTANGTANLKGQVNLGDASADDIQFNGSLATSIPIKTTNSYDLGTATIGLRAIYFGQSSSSRTGKVLVATHSSASRIYTIPDAGADANFAMTQGAQTLVGAITTNNPVTITDPSDTSKQLKLTALNNQTSAITTLASNSSSTQTITLPNITTTLAGLTGNQTFTGILSYSGQASLMYYTSATSSNIAANTTITSGNSYTWSAEYDNTSNFSSGVFTVPANGGGKYQISATLQLAAVGGSISRVQLGLKKNSTSQFQILDDKSALVITAGSLYTASGTTILSLAAADTITPEFLATGTNFTVTGGASRQTWIAINKVI